MNILELGSQLPIGTYHPHSHFTHVVNFICTHSTESKNCVVAVVTPHIGAGPNNIVIDTHTSIPTLDTLKITANSIILNSSAYSKSLIPCYAITCQDIVDNRQMNPNNISFLKKFLLDSANQKSMVSILKPNQDLDQVNDLFFQSWLRKMLQWTPKILFQPVNHDFNSVRFAINHISGSGYGLTPAGDDYIIGILLALNTIKHTEHCNKEQIKRIDQYLTEIWNIYTSKSGIETNDLTQTFLYFAAQGFLYQRFEQVLHALFIEDRIQLKQALTNYLKLGASSGADTLTGFYQQCMVWLNSE